MGKAHRGEGKEIRLLLDRKEYADEATLGDLYVDGVWECVTLEDELAINGKKEPGKTCIPDGIYEVIITASPKFKRLMPLLVGVPNYDGIRIHSGVDATTTEGCLQVGEKIVHAGMPFLTHSKAAFDRLFAKLTDAKSRGEKILIEVAA